jgi:hypothetical protein
MKHKIEFLKPGEKPDGYLMRGFPKMVKEANHKAYSKPLKMDKPSLAFIGWEDKANYYGNFATGFGIFGVAFPKSSTRDLTKKEKVKYKKVAIQHSNGLVVKDFI